jgi:hypothetical protein
VGECIDIAPHVLHKGRRAILIEREPTYAAIAAARIRAAMAQPDLFAHAEEPEE